MLISEFTQMTGFKPSEDYYHTVIEPEYLNSELDKSAWCKQWKKNGGFQEAYDCLAKEVNEKERVVAILEQRNKIADDEIKRLRENADRAMFDVQVERTAKEESQKKYNEMSNWRLDLMRTLLEISERTSSSELRQLVIDEVGFKEYIKYKFDHNMNISEADRKEIMDIIDDKLNQYIQ